MFIKLIIHNINENIITNLVSNGLPYNVKKEYVEI